MQSPNAAIQTTRQSGNKSTQNDDPFMDQEEEGEREGEDNGEPGNGYI